MQLSSFSPLNTPYWPHAVLDFCFLFELFESFNAIRYKATFTTSLSYFYWVLPSSPKFSSLVLSLCTSSAKLFTTDFLVPLHTLLIRCNQLTATNFSIYQSFYQLILRVTGHPRPGFLQCVQLFKNLSKTGFVFANLCVAYDLPDFAEIKWDCAATSSRCSAVHEFEIVLSS